MHSDEIHVNIDLARALVVAQLPLWRELPVEPSPFAGTDHVMFRLGADKALRFPRRPSAVLQVLKEQEFLPAISRSLSVATPMPIKAMRACDQFGYPWSVCSWVEGHTLQRTPDFVESDFVHEICSFLAAMKHTKVDNIPPPGQHNFGRGVPLQSRDEQTRAAILAISDEFDPAELLLAWDKSLAARVNDGKPELIHGDLAPSNILMRDGKLAGVIDWGGMAVGDPACDLMIAWNFLDNPWRGMFHLAVGVDDDEWMRGVGWALSVAAIQLPYYRSSSPTISATARATLRAILEAKGEHW
jgi:aminoglycoside phosphotransferase (APT) family kinase protein